MTYRGNYRGNSDRGYNSGYRGPKPKVSIPPELFNSNHTHLLKQKASSVYRSYDEAGLVGNIQEVGFRYNRTKKCAEIKVILFDANEPNDGRVETWRFIANPNFGKQSEGFSQPDRRDQIWSFIGSEDVTDLLADDEDPEVPAKQNVA